ncbi:C40 family peptidase [Desulfosporosinus sp. OT]|uniref:C40 family peptidase n=1 Tax=Desulfosporosinus sp. OT TaxID=913865 RepID=UPI000223B077|nr:C40 family peptidase [Desulfosporosinus sp. OT]EGW39557.1 nlpC/P60 family protein [Desulfosporosinus sp. OT]
MQVWSTKAFSKIGVVAIRRIFLSILVSIIICLSIQPVNAATLYDNLSALKNNSSSLQDQVNVQQQLQAIAESQAQSIQESINVLKSAIDQDNLVIEQHKKTIADLDLEQQKLADQQKKDTETLESYVRNQYTEGDTPYLSYISWLVGSTSINDLINRCSYIDTVLSFYRDLRFKISANADEIKVKRSLEEDETKKLTDEIQSKQQLLDGLNVALAKQTELVNSITNDEAQIMQVQSRGQENISETERLIAAEQLQAQLVSQAKYQEILASQLKTDSLQGTFSTPVKLDGQVGQLLSFASTFLGVPYTWGGTYPQFDCSSFVQYVYGQFGIKLSRVTWDQYSEGQSVSRENLQAGDLVFFSTYQAGPSHVGIYVGNGIMINSSNSGVSYASINSEYWSSRYYGARRVIAQ